VPRRRQWGRIRKLPSGRYQARLPDQRTAPHTFTTKADAARWLAAAETDVLRGAYAPQQWTELTVSEWLTTWHEEHSVHKRPGTLARDRSAITRHIVPALGDRPLVELKPVDVQRFVALIASEVGPGTTRSIFAVLRSSLNDAVRLEMLARSPARGIRLPALERVEVTTLRIDELHRLGAAVEAPWRPMVYVAGTCGLRFAEIVGLRWGRVDLTGGSLTVVETAPQRDSDRAEPKSRAGRRNVPVTSYVAEMLREHCSVRDADALVFTARHGGRIYAPNWHRYVWSPARAAAGFPSLRFHHFRHSAVPLWISMGANLLQVSRWLGHSSVQITADVYGHLFPETNDLVVARLDDALRTAATES
jgi:integrase